MKSCTLLAGNSGKLMDISLPSASHESHYTFKFYVTRHESVSRDVALEHLCSTTKSIAMNTILETCTSEHNSQPMTCKHLVNKVPADEVRPYSSSKVNRSLSFQVSTSSVAFSTSRESCSSIPILVLYPWSLIYRYGSITCSSSPPCRLKANPLITITQ